MPPDMHWAVVLLISLVTLGLFGVYWMHKEASFVKKIDPSSNAIQTWLGVAACWVFQIVLFFSAGLLGAMGAADVAGLLHTLANLVNLVMVALMIVTAFSMRTSLTRYYNTVEPIGLQLSPAMTFFFNFTYFQYHFSRIAELKRRQPRPA